MEATNVARLLTAGETTVDPCEQHSMSLEAEEPAELLHHYLRELLTLFQLKTFVPTRLDVHELTDRSLRATVRGEGFDPERHDPQPEVKAVTRHGLKVTRTRSGWLGTILLDL